MGSNDHVVLDLNRRAAAQLRCEHRLDVVPGASHLFEEPGTLHQAAALAAQWFATHMRSGASGNPPTAVSMAYPISNTVASS